MSAHSIQKFILAGHYQQELRQAGKWCTVKESNLQPGD